MIFILGGEGFVGSAIVRHCQRRRLPHAVITRANYHHFLGCPCDVFINANGNSKKLLAEEEPVEDFDLSVRSVRASLADFPAKSYVYLSSCDVYPDCSSPSTTREDSIMDVSRQNAYGFHKYLAEQCVRHAAHRWLILRLGGMVGPGLKKNAIFDILNGGPLWLDPASELQYLHTDDVASILFQLLDQGVDRHVLNCCGRGVVRLTEVMEWAGRDVEARPGSARVRYEVAVAKLERFVSVPDTRNVVRDFVAGEFALRSEDCASRLTVGAP